MNTSPDHPDFTALALGEHIHGTPAQAVLEALRTSVAARHEADQIRNTAGHLALVLKGQPPLRLDAARRNAIFNADPAALRERFAAEDRAAFAEELPAPAAPRPQRTWIYPTAAAAAVAVAGIFVMKFLPGYTFPSQRPATPVVENDPVPTGKVIVSPVSTQSPAPERAHNPTPVPAVVDNAVKPPLPDKGKELPATQKATPPMVTEVPTVIPPMPAPQLPAPDSLPPEAVDPTAVKRRPPSGALAVPPPKRGNQPTR